MCVAHTLYLLYFANTSKMYVLGFLNSFAVWSKHITLFQSQLLSEVFTRMSVQEEITAVKFILRSFLLETDETKRMASILEKVKDNEHVATYGRFSVPELKEQLRVLQSQLPAGKWSYRCASFFWIMLFPFHEAIFWQFHAVIFILFLLFTLFLVQQVVSVFDFILLSSHIDNHLFSFSFQPLLASLPLFPLVSLLSSPSVSCGVNLFNLLYAF